MAPTTSPEQTCECGHPTLMHSRSLTRSLLGRCLIDGCPCRQFTPTPTNAEGEVSDGRGPQEPQTGDDELAEWRRIAREGSTAGECSVADLRALIARLDGAEGAWVRLSNENLGLCDQNEALTTRLATVEAERDEAIRERDALREALTEARELVEFWSDYADDYFTAKHDLAGNLAKLDAILATLTPEDDNG